MDTESTYPPETGALSLKEAIQADLSRVRAVNMRFIERLDAMAEKEERPERLAQLNNASVKTARAVRQIAVLQLEIAGDRALPNVRGPAVPANANKPRAQQPESEQNGPRPCPRPWEKGDYTDYDDYTDEDRRMVLHNVLDEANGNLRAALNEDFRAAGREGPCRKSLGTRLELIHGIPHPVADECLRAMNPEIALLLLGAHRLNTVLAPGSPDALAEYEAEQAEWATLGHRLDSS